MWRILDQGLGNASTTKKCVAHCGSGLIVGEGRCGAQQDFAERHRI